MTKWVAHALKFSVTGFFCLSSASVFAADDKVSHDKKVQTTAATSLKDILQQAGEQGLIRLEDKDGASETSDKASKIVQTPAQINPAIDCSVSQIFDFSDYATVISYDGVLEAKSALKSAKTTADIQKLAKQYMSLGFGAEVVALATPYETQDAKLLAAMGRAVDGNAEATDINIITQYENCSESAAFWSQVAQASHEFNDPTDETWGLSMGQRQILLELPEHLKTVLVTRLGIHAAELEQKTLADQLLSLVEPQSRRGLLPRIKDDDRLYYYALVRQLKGDSVSRQIFEHLGREDGVYQTRALLKLVKDSAHKNDHTYDEFSSALLSVQQQYRGSAPSRKATLEVVRHQAEDNQYIYAIDLSKKEFSIGDVEFQDAINVIGSRLDTNLLSEKSHLKLSALNGYLYDPEFFETYIYLSDLKSHAYDSALSLNLPELAIKIPTETIMASKDLIFTRQLADAQMAYKKGDYEKVIELSKSQPDDERYRTLLLKASKKIDSQLTQAKVANTVPEGSEKLKYEANIALQNSRWDAAQSALKSLSETDASDADTKETLAIVEYVAANDDAHIRNAKSDRVEDIENFNDKIEADISLVKAYLKNG